MKRSPSLRGRISLLYVFTLLPLLISSLIFSANTQNLVTRTEQLFSSQKTLEILTNQVISLEESLSSFLTYGDNRMRDLLYQKSSDLESSLQSLVPQSFPENTALRISLLENMVATLMAQTNRIIQLRRGRLESQFRESFGAFVRIRRTITWMIYEITWEVSSVTLDDFSLFNAWYGNLQVLGLLMLMGFGLTGLLLLVFYARKITGPIRELADHSKSITMGNLAENEFRPENPSSEMVDLARAFNYMTRNLRDSLGAREAKIELEKELLSQNLKNLEMQNALKSSQLLALQNQINPHFLYNTLNTGVQLSQLENAQRTSDFLDHLAELFRHNLKDPSKAISLQEEIQGLKNFLEIMSIRFGDRFAYELELDPNCMDLQILPMVFQPLVENSLFHGLSEIETGGKIRIFCEKKPGKTVLGVEDNGQGIPEAVMEKILAPSYFQGLSLKGEQIGLRNVLWRLSLFWGDSEFFDIQTSEKGTLISITLLDNEHG